MSLRRDIAEIIDPEAFAVWFDGDRQRPASSVGGCLDLAKQRYEALGKDGAIMERLGI